MKRYIAILLALLAVLSLAACRKVEKDPKDTTDADVITTFPEDTTATDHDCTTQPEDTTEPEDTTKDPDQTSDAPATDEGTTAPINEINEDSAVRIAKDYLGERDPDTGYLYSYQFIEKTAEGEYKIKVSWYLEEDERYSTCGYLLVSPEGKVTKFDW